MAKTFTALSSKVIAEKIREAQKRVAVIAPSIHEDVGQALAEAVKRLGSEQVDLVTDLDEKVFRLGYGNIEAITQLKSCDIKIRNHAGIRIGLFICDDSAWVFSPVALYIETEPATEEFPNALTLSANEATKLLMRVSETARAEIIREAETPELAEEAQEAFVELSQFSDNSIKLEEVCKNLEIAPPVAFDISRQVHVFEPYIQYVELKLLGCSIQRHKMKLPPHILGLASANNINARLSTTFNLINKNSAVSAKPLEDEVNKLRNVFTKSLGKLGRVLLKAQRKNFDDQVSRIREMIQKHREKIEQQLAGELERTQNELIENFLPSVKERPPMELLAQIIGPTPTEDNVRTWLKNELSRCMPPPDKLITKMELECVFKDVTFETLKDEGLEELLKETFPLVDWDKPFNEFMAAKSV